MAVKFTPLITLYATIAACSILPLAGGVAELATGQFGLQTLVRSILTFLLLYGLYRRRNIARHIFLLGNYILALAAAGLSFLSFSSDIRLALIFTAVGLLACLFINQYQFRSDLVALFKESKY